ncbi:DUF2149 domain-containing protein [Methanobacterium ferruginis]|jgi:hypothetical protein|uniref:DUF2149 domain-containing protein n=1 Tax=Methanobacterium ferruginis TaxID=710191 RepID=UPI0025741E7E|nr:DUF2149 domain-containing protein [Methanobacterium ferruginis]BDZ67496.1 membrane protein [Methanobacterium ferruginis]
MSKRRKFLDADSDDDPTSGIANMTDSMLVLAVGFLIFAVIALQSNPALISSSSGSSQSTVPVSTGETLNETPENESGSSGGYQEVGTVYKDPETGELVMVS